MKRFPLLLSFFFITGYAQVRWSLDRVRISVSGAAQAELQIKLESVWEKEIPVGVSDFIFLDEDGYNIFSVQCKDPEKALKEKRILMVQDGKLEFFEDDTKMLSKKVELKGGYAISKNGHNIAALEGLTLRLLDWQGNELARGEMAPKGYEHITLYPLGNDEMVVVSSTGGEGRFYGVRIFVRQDKDLTEVFSNEETSWLVDYAENGEKSLLVIENKDMVLFNGSGEEILRYICPRACRKGFLSPFGSYIAEITAGKYVMIYDRNGEVIAEHHVQGLGDHYAAFSPDEKYLCVTPGPWRVYFFETETGKMLWEYVDVDENTHFSSVAISPPMHMTFAGRSEAILKPGEFNGSIDELNKRVIENATKDRTVSVIANGKFLKSLGPFPGKGFGTQLQTPEVSISQDQNFLWVKTPTKSYIYRISIKHD